MKYQISKDLGSLDKIMKTVGPSSLADLQKGRNISGESGTDATKPPAWLTPELYDPAHIQEFFNKHLFSFVCAWHCSLTLGFSLPALLKPLVYTKNSSTPKTAQKRYMDTFTHLSEWHQGDIFDPTTKAFASLQGVRTFHATVRAEMTRDLPGTTWISAYNMGCVQAGFFAAISMHAEKFGLTGPDGSDANLAKYISFWRCIGRQLGIADEFNLCFEDKDTVTKILGEIINDVLLPDEANPPPEYTPIADAYVGGLNLLFFNIPLISVKSSLAFSFWAGGYPQTRWPKLNCCDWVRFYMIRVVMFCVGKLPLFGRVMSWATKRTFRSNSNSSSSSNNTKNRSSSDVSRGAIAGGWYAGNSTASLKDGDSLSEPLVMPVSTCPVSGMRSRKRGVSSCAGALLAEKHQEAGIDISEDDSFRERCCCKPQGEPTALCLSLFGLLLFLLLLFVGSFFGVVYLYMMIRHTAILS
jgi:hypothetical protein